MPARLDEVPTASVALDIATGLLLGRALFLAGRWLWPHALSAVDDNLAPFD